MEFRKQCCMGIFLSALGFTDDEIQSRVFPYEVFDETGRVPPEAAFLHENPFVAKDNVADELAHLNDSSAYSDEEREQEIKEIFANHGIEVEFVN
jgi:hypothetical protein